MNRYKNHFSYDENLITSQDNVVLDAEELKDSSWVPNFCLNLLDRYHNNDIEGIELLLENLPEFECYQMYTEIPEIAYSDEILNTILFLFQNYVELDFYLLPLLNIFLHII